MRRTFNNFNQNLEKYVMNNFKLHT